MHAIKDVTATTIVRPLNHITAQLYLICILCIAAIAAGLQGASSAAAGDLTLKTGTQYIPIEIGAGIAAGGSAALSGAYQACFNLAFMGIHLQALHSTTSVQDNRRTSCLSEGSVFVMQSS